MRFKLLTATALSAALVTAGFGTAFAHGHHGRFDDLGNAQWAASAIETLSTQGIVNGLTSTRFGPQRPITIGQLAAILLRFNGQVQSSEPFGAQVSQAARQGLLTGLGGSVGSSEDATRAQAMTMLINGLNLGGSATGETTVLGRFHDSHGVPGWARHAMGLAVSLGLLEGSAGDLMPQSSITRAQLAVILARIESNLSLMPSEGSQGHAGSVTGVVTAIGSGQITVGPGSQMTDQNQQGDQGEQENGHLAYGTYNFSANMKIVIPGEGAHGSLSQVQVGDYVHLVMWPSGLVHMIIVLPQGAGQGSTQGVPTNLTATETATGISLGWSAVSGATSYQVLESNGSTYSAVSAANGGTPAGTSTTVTGLTAGTTYAFEVEAVASGNASSPSSPSPAVEWGARSGASATVSANASGSETWLTITVPYDKTLDASSVDMSPSDYLVNDQTTAQTFTVATVSASGSDLTIQTQVFPDGLYGGSSNVIDVTTSKSVVNDSAGAPTTPIDASSAPRLAAPTNVSAAEAANGIALGWSGVSGATSYQVLESSGSGYSAVTAANGGTPAGTSTTVTGLSAGTTYTFEVEALNAASAPSAVSAPSNAVEWGALAGANATVAVQAGTGGSYLAISVPYDKTLNAATLDGTTGDYTVTDLTTHQTLGVAGVSASGSSVTVQTMAYGTAYSGPADTIQVTTAKSVVDDTAGAPTTAIDASGALSVSSPTITAATEAQTGVSLTWTGVSGAVSYKVLASSGSGYATVPQANGGTPAGTGTTVTGLGAGTTYTFEVEAVDASGNVSSPSSPSSAVEWGANPGSGLSVTVNPVAGSTVESFTITITYDKALDASTLDTVLSDYTIKDTTSGQVLNAASVSVSGDTVIIQTALYGSGSIDLSNGVQVTTAKSVIDDQAGAPTAPIDATGTL